MDANGEVETNTPAKRPKLTELTINEQIRDSLPTLKDCWTNGKDLQDANSGLRVSSTPFQYCELEHFITENNELDSFVGSAISTDEVFYISLAKDLLQFKKTPSLNHIRYDFTGLDPIRAFFNGPALEFVKEMTGLPLNGQVDLFLSIYEQTDHLLCHDDELESRRIAFILYLSQDWKPEYGGSLDLFGAVEYPLAPTTVQTSIIPAYNKFVFFDVNCRSFHQVSEVVEPGVRRLALSGWFLGEPLARPEIDICNPILKSLGMLEGTGFINATYMDPATQQSINAQLEAEAQVMLVDFLAPEHYEQVMKDLKERKWDEKGPANMEYCLESEIDDVSIKKFEQVFKSKEFHSLLEILTEFEFSAPTTRVVSRLSKYGHRCYQLITNNKSAAEDETQEEDGDGDETEQVIDIVYFAGDFEWNESYGGEIIYSEIVGGEQLITVTPYPNSLAIIVRSLSIHSYVRYVNCTAGQSNYCCYRATYSFDNEIDSVD